MAPRPRATSLLATIVGWVIVALVVWWLFGALIGTLRWVVRAVVFAAVLIALVSVYVRLKFSGRR